MWILGSNYFLTCGGDEKRAIHTAQLEHLSKCLGGEMVDTGDLKSPGRNPVPVRVRP